MRSELIAVITVMGGIGGLSATHRNQILWIGVALASGNRRYGIGAGQNTRSSLHSHCRFKYLAATQQ